MSAAFLRIGTRGSPLALAQARETRRRLATLHDIHEDRIELVIIKTTGDAIVVRPLSEAGGKGLFTKELDIAQLAGDIDIAVHSAKDLPTLLPDGLDVGGYLPREDVRDALISPRAANIDALPKGARVGTASLRRAAQLKRLRPDFETPLLRGNVQTRLNKAEAGEIDATLLALAGLKRLGLAQHATCILEIDQFLPAVGQGAIAINAEKLRRPLKRLQAHLAAHPYLIGDRFTVADLNLAECLRYAQGHPTLLGEFPAVKAWLETCQSRPAFQRMWAERMAEPA